MLVELTRMEGTRHGRMIASQMLDVAIRVQAIRPFAVSQMVRTSFLPWRHVAISFCNKFNVFVNTLLYSFDMKSEKWRFVVGLVAGEFTYPSQ